VLQMQKPKFILSHIMSRTSYISMRWWCPFCSRPIRSVEFS